MKRICRRSRNLVETLPNFLPPEIFEIRERRDENSCNGLEICQESLLSFGLISTIRKCNHWKRKTRSTCVSFLLSDGNRESRARLIGKYANTVKHTNYLEACLNWRTLDACRTIVHKGSEQHHARSPRTMLAGLIRQLFLLA